MPQERSSWNNQKNDQLEKNKISKGEKLAWTVGGTLAGVFFIIMIGLAAALANSRAILAGGDIFFREQRAVGVPSTRFWTLQGPTLRQRESQPMLRLLSAPAH
jgi:hypothetical protein